MPFNCPPSCSMFWCSVCCSGSVRGHRHGKLSGNISRTVNRNWRVLCRFPFDFGLPFAHAKPSVDLSFAAVIAITLVFPQMLTIAASSRSFHSQFCAFFHTPSPFFSFLLCAAASLAFFFSTHVPAAAFLAFCPAWLESVKAAGERISGLVSPGTFVFQLPFAIFAAIVFVFSSSKYNCRQVNVLCFCAQRKKTLQFKERLCCSDL